MRISRQGIFLIIGCLAIIVGFFSHAAYLSAPAAQAPEVVVVITKGDGVSAIAAKLKNAGVTMNGIGYRMYALTDRSTFRPVPGTYRVQPGMSYRHLSRLFALGPARREGEARIIEGWTLRDIQQYLATEKHVSESSMKALMGESLDQQIFDASLREDFLFLEALPKKRSLEGYLFPNTYRIWEDQLPEGLVRKQLAEFSKRYASSTIDASLHPLKSLDEVVILASIIEKEVREPEDRRLVAGLFLRRLREGMPLQSDATLHYLTRSGRSQATRDDLAIDSPYNSYKYRGLPPGPICNPGASALDAVLNPKASSYRYFLTDEAGKVFYAETFEGHIQNRRKAGY